VYPVCRFLEYIFDIFGFIYGFVFEYFMGFFMVSMRIDVRGLSDDSRLSIPRLLKSRYGHRGAARLLGISVSSTTRYLSGVRRFPDDVVRRCLEYINDEEFRDIVVGRINN